MLGYEAITYPVAVEPRAVPGQAPSRSVRASSCEERYRERIEDFFEPLIRER